MNEKNAIKFLFELDDIIKRVGLRYSLYGGTCLGAVREKRFIPIDIDMDFACLMEDFLPVVKIFKEELEEAGFKTHWLDHRHKRKWDKGCYGVKIDKYGTHCDFVTFFKKGNKRYLPSHLDNFYLVHKAEYIENLKEIEFYGRTFLVPVDCNGYLTEKYGNWRVPHKKFYNVSQSRIYGTGMTFGGFDLCHLGHINLLKQAKSKCEKLIVCVSTDERLLKQKGVYPILKYEDRAYLVSLTGYSDIIDKQGIEGKKPLVEKYNPDVLLVGSDWTKETYDGFKLQQTIFLERTKGISSSWYRERIERKK